MIANPLYPLFNDDEIRIRYPSIKKIENMIEYSSDNADQISREELKNSIEKLKILSK